VLRGVLFGGLAVLLASGCGSRTSMLDQEAYEVGSDGVVNGGSSNGGKGNGASGAGSSGHAGSPSTGSGGGSVSPSAGATGVGGKTGGGGAVDPSLASAPCANYCPGYGTECAARLKGSECLPTCLNELNSFGPACQSLGIQALTCLTPFFTPGGNQCDAAVGRALSKCSKIVKQFEACKKKASGGTAPSPTTPSPTTPTSPKLDPTSCADGGNAAGPGFCLSTYNCQNGSYIVTCDISPMTMLASCTCMSPAGNQMITVPDVADPCELAAHSCP
jgi:hypothetical protein